MKNNLKQHDKMHIILSSQFCNEQQVVLLKTYNITEI